MLENKKYQFNTNFFRPDTLVVMDTMVILFWVLVTTIPTMAMDTTTTMVIMDMDMEDTDHMVMVMEFTDPMDIMDMEVFSETRKPTELYSI